MEPPHRRATLLPMPDNDPEGPPATRPEPPRTPTSKADTRRVADLGVGSVGKELEAMNKGMLKGITTIGDLAKHMKLDFAGPQSELGNSLRAMADQLRVPIDLPNFEAMISPPDLAALDIGPSAEARAAWEIREEVSSLREVTATMATTVAAIADMANDLKPALTDYAASAERSATIQTRLTWANVALAVVIAVLTGVLVVIAVRGGV